jgi:hypothetical protein
MLGENAEKNMRYYFGIGTSKKIFYIFLKMTFIEVILCAEFKKSTLEA